MKKVTICASTALSNEIATWRMKLENLGYEVIKFPTTDSRSYAKIHGDHYKKISESDIVFVLNVEKDGVENYIGPSTFAEIAFAIGLNLALDKKIEIYSLNPLPRNLPYSKELNLWKGLGWIQDWSKSSG